VASKFGLLKVGSVRRDQNWQAHIRRGAYNRGIGQLQPLIVDIKASNPAGFAAEHAVQASSGAGHAGGRGHFSLDAPGAGFTIMSCRYSPSERAATMANQLGRIKHIVQLMPGRKR
jgi:hypothetical protein